MTAHDSSSARHDSTTGAQQPVAGAWRLPAALGAATFILMLPVTLIVPVLKEIVGDRFAASTFWTHGFMFINMLGAFLAAPLVAILCDRAGSRIRIASVALLLDAALFGVMVAAPNLAVLLAARALEGVAHILALTALMATAADHVGLARRGRMMGVMGACMMFGTAAGTRIGGAISAGSLWQSWSGWSFVAAACASLIAAAFVATVIPDAQSRGKPRLLRESVALLRTSPRLLIAYTYTFIDRFCVGVIIASFVLFLPEVHGVSPDGRGKLLAMFLGPFALCVYPAGRLVDRIGFAGPLVFGSAVFGMLFACYGFVPLEWLPVVMVVSGLASAVMFAPTLSLCAELSPVKQRGAAYAGFNAAGSLGMLCGPIVGGTICQLLRAPLGVAGAYQAAFIFAGAAQVVCALLTVRWLIGFQRSARSSSLPHADAVFAR